MGEVLENLAIHVSVVDREAIGREELSALLDSMEKVLVVVMTGSNDEAIQHVARVEPVLRPPTSLRDAEHQPLSPREVEVLRLVTDGYGNRDIARAMGTAEGTVKNQLSSIFAKLRVRNRTQAALKALEHGLV